ncbi:MAG: hypothetical protein JW864_02775 [Spirochaetes bacterium]|nr:hypothetical protein [Spirochaetota bacterium]
MKDQLYNKMKPLFHLIDHDYQEISPLELLVIQLARGNSYNTRIIGLEAIKKFREDNPDCAVTFKPNHLSEADFIMLSLVFRENGMRVLTEGGSNLFIDNIDIFNDLLPAFVNAEFSMKPVNGKMSVAEYLSTRGSFKIVREPCKMELEDGKTIKIGNKEILSLSRAYRYHLIKQKEMYVTFPGYSVMNKGMFNIVESDVVKTGRSYTGKTDGFHHLPFQMDIEASYYAGVPLYIVDVNIAYEPVLEDMNFLELIKMAKSDSGQDDLYKKDLGYIIKQFCKGKTSGELSIKFGEPYMVNTSSFKEDILNIKIKKSAKKLAEETFEKMLSMQPVFPANIYFSAFNDSFNRISIDTMKERIDDIRDYLRKATYGKYNRRPDLHYLFDYRNKIITADEIINRTFQKFSIKERQITGLDDDMFVVYRKDVATQYKNHTRHFFEEIKYE